MSLGSASSFAEQVFKCNVNGKITYQAAPCKEGKANQVETHSDLNEAEAKAAQERADRERATAAAASSISSTQQTSAPTVKAKGDCGGLSARREQAFSRRNAALASARQGEGASAGSAGDMAIAQMQAEIGSIESTMRAHGCSF
ncbi:MAG: hypothetical protein U1F34_09415 [Gammaproteobacteria bacterium]